MQNYRNNFKTYLDDLAKRQPSPGGGSVLALNFCLGVGLIEKSIKYSVKLKPANEKDKSLSKKLKIKARPLIALRKKAYSVIDKDAYLFNKIMVSKGKRRKQFIQRSENLISELIEYSGEVFSLAKEVESGIKNNIISDFKIGLELIKVTVLGSILNLEANQRMFGTRNKKIPKFKKQFKIWQKI